MATITGMTAAAMIAIRDQTIIGAVINGSGHLILTRFDETTIDAGSITDAVDNASTTVSGIVELATSAETTTGTDDTRAVTPAGLSAVSSTKQPIDDDLTAISNISPANDDFIQRKSGVWVNRTLAQVTTDLSATLLPKIGGAMTGAITTTRSATTDIVLAGNVGVEAFNRFRTYADGKYEVGPGSATRDTNFYRNGVGLWKTDNSVEVGTDLTVDGAFTGASNQNMGAWTSFTPTWTGTGSNPALGNGTLVGRYMRIGRLIKCHINLIPGTTTTFGSGSYAWALPFTSANVGCTMIGNAQLSAASRWMGHVMVIPNATTCTAALPTAAGNTDGTVMGATAPVAFANGNQLRLTFDYEAAS